MARASAVKSAAPQLTPEELAEGFAQLVSEQWRLGEADQFLRRVKAVPSISAPYLVGHLVSGGPKEREMATVLLQLLAGPRVIVPLREALKSSSLADEARVAAMLVLHRLGEGAGLDIAPTSLRDPRGLFESIWETVMDRSEDEEAFLEALLLGIQEAPADERDALVRSLAEPADARVLRLLRPLLFSKRSSTVLAAIEAIEEVRGFDALTLVKDVSDHDPSPQVRKRARTAYGRLFMMSGLQLPGFGLPPLPAVRPVPERELPLARSWLTLIDGKGDQAVVLARRQGKSSLKVLTVIISDTEGIKRCIGADGAREEDLAGIEARLRSEGLAPVPVSAETCRRAVEDARKLHLSLRRRLPMELEIWRGVMISGPQAEGHGAPSWPAWRESLGGEGLLDQLKDTGRLAEMPEFQRWTFDAAAVWPYVDEWMRAPLEKQSGAAGEATLKAIVATAARDLFDPGARRLWSRRLYRQSALLDQLGQGDAAGLAACAGLGLDPMTGVPIEVHPFASAMVLSSLYRAGLRLRQPGLPGLGL